MQTRTISFGQNKVDFYFAGSLSKLKSIADSSKTILITDENVYNAHAGRLSKWDPIVIKAGEQFKVQGTVDYLIEALIEREADRRSLLVGVGGGVVTDIVGYTASVYMRGIRFGFVPTSLLALVDASIGGKNGIDVGSYKNMVGVIRQPAFLLHDPSFLDSLPEGEWRNGFAEIIKHAAIKDAVMFRELQSRDLGYYRKKKSAIAALVQRNALLKAKVVQKDEFEQGDRKLLNFGHTLGHALENQYMLSHGEAISIGMGFASELSEELLGFKGASKVKTLLQQYGLPVQMDFEKEKVMNVLKMDKKRQKDAIQFILLQRIGRAVIQSLPIKQLYQLV